MLAKRFKLPIQDAFKRRGNTLRSSGFTLRLLSSEQPMSRFAIVVGSSVFPKAVLRNRIRRIFFNIARGAAPALPCRDYLMIALPHARDLSIPEARAEIEQLFREAASRGTL